MLRKKAKVVSKGELQFKPQENDKEYTSTFDQRLFMEYFEKQKIEITDMEVDILTLENINVQINKHTNELVAILSQHPLTNQGS